MFRHLTIEQHGDVALLRIDRPPANALDLELLEEGARAHDELAAASPGAVVITGRDGFFSAGVDLKLAPTLDEEAQRRMVTGINRLFAGWYAFPRPVICAVNGHAIAGGLILALCGDQRVGARQGKLGLTEVTAGIPYPRAAIAIVRAELSAASARRLVLGGELVEPGGRPPARARGRAPRRARRRATCARAGREPGAAPARGPRAHQAPAARWRRSPSPERPSRTAARTRSPAAGSARRPRGRPPESSIAAGPVASASSAGRPPASRRS